LEDTSAVLTAARANAEAKTMIVRFMHDGKIRGGSYSEENGIVSGGEVLALEDVELLAPCQPSKIVCVGLNYTEHARELKMQLPSEPILFLKPPSAVLAPGRRSSIPFQAGRWTMKASLEW